MSGFDYVRIGEISAIQAEGAIAKAGTAGTDSMRSVAVVPAGEALAANAMVLDRETPIVREDSYRSPPRPSIKWRPGRDQLLFNRGSEIYLLEADGSNMRLLVDIEADRSPDMRASSGHWPLSSFDVSPDGAFLVYDHGLSRPGIRLLHIDSGRTQMWNSLLGVFPAWSPDGARLAFIRRKSGSRGNLGIWRVDRPSRDDLAMGPSISAPWTGDETPVWSPAGDRVAFVGSDPDGRAIYTVGADGADVRRITDTASAPSWSPDGSRIAFAKSDGEGVGLYTIKADGTDLERVTTIAGWSWLSPWIEWMPQVAWSPDGSSILYTCGGAACLVAIDGTPLIRPQFRLDGGDLAAWSPDGTRIAIRSLFDADGGYRRYRDLPLSIPTSEVRRKSSWWSWRRMAGTSELCSSKIRTAATTSQALHGPTHPSTLAIAGRRARI